MNKTRIIIVSLTVILSFTALSLPAQRKRIIVDPATTLVDGTSAPFNKLIGGDTVFFAGGPREYLLIRNFTGTLRKPICFINIDGPVTINTDHYYGIVLQNCKYVKLTGTGDPEHYYGFKITRVSNGAGMSIGTQTSYFEVDHVYIDNTSLAGIYAKTDPDCDFTSTREKFTQYNTIIHDNYIANTGDEGMYIGSSFYSGKTLECNKRDTTVYPSLLNGVRVYNNIVRYTGWDGIQVASASNNCQIFNNLVMYDSQDEKNFQMSGILIGGGSQCDCYNNYIYKGKGDGIESLGIGNYRIFNNVIVDAGRSFQPGDPSKMKYGIYCNDNSAKSNYSFSILFNTIINPKSNGVRFSSAITRKNLIASNVIINPGLGGNAYVVVTDPSGDVVVKNNYTAMTSANAGFIDSTYKISASSPLNNGAWTDSRRIGFDYFNHPRPLTGSDIGMAEFNTKRPLYVLPPEYRDTMIFAKYVSTFTIDPIPLREPVSTDLSIAYSLDLTMDVQIDIYNMEGDRIFHDEVKQQPKGPHTWEIKTGNFPVGLCMFTVRSGNQSYSGRFYKSK